MKDDLLFFTPLNTLFQSPDVNKWRELEQPTVEHKEASSSQLLHAYLET